MLADASLHVAGGGLLPGAQQGTSRMVLIVNSVCNDRGMIRRRTADYFVTEGRAVWVGPEQIRLLELHPKNVAAKAEAGKWHNTWVRKDDGPRMLECHDIPGTASRPGRHIITVKPTVKGAKHWKNNPVLYRSGPIVDADRSRFDAAK